MENFAASDIQAIADDVMKNRMDVVDSKKAKRIEKKGALYENIDLNSVGSSDSRIHWPRDNLLCDPEATGAG